ncbi:MFS transporter [candidate division WS5 bacterium]|uniref:MFS transporter n=1 Tax=candidate division WS5 bacterium TaxID=2093353 RepID=A0A419DAT4_9BACT|nr:MAG: MFS transporter [candidate division WS5 bacterium]
MKKQNVGTSKKATLFVATTGSFIVPFAGSAIMIGLPSISQEFALDTVTLGWVHTSFSLSLAIMLIPLGKIADIYGRKKIFLLGTIVYTISSLLAAISNSAYMLIVFRVMQGIGGAALISTIVAILTLVFPIAERGKVLGINTASVYVGTSVGPVIGGLLTQYFGWRSIFIILVPLGLIIISAVFWKLRSEWTGVAGEKFDLTGAFVYGISMVSLMYGLSLLPNMVGAWLMVLSVLGVVAFVKWEMKVKTPVLNINLLRHNVIFLMSNLAVLLCYLATNASGFILVIYLQSIKGLSPQYTGLILIFQPIFMAIFSPLAGRFSDRIEPRLISSIGMVLNTLSLVILIFIGGNTGLGLIIASLVIQGLGFALFSAPNTIAVMNSVNTRIYGVASGTLGTMRNIGKMLSLGIAMMLFSIYTGGLQITSDNHTIYLQTMRVAFLIFSVICFCGIFASLARGNVRHADS